MKSFKDLREKTLTPAEKKKREEIAKAMERENPGMDMRKKMAIATWQAKKVAEVTTSPLQKIRMDKEKADRSKDDKDKSQAKRMTDKQYASYKVKMKEEVELDELNKSTLGSYIKKASGNMAGNAAVAAAQASSSMKKSSPDVKRNIKNRMTGIAKATDKLTKEEAEQIDEISKKTLGSYIKKAKDDLGNREAEVTRNRYVDPRGVKDPVKHNNALLMKRANRRDNINKAVDKLTKEQAEDDMPASPDEASMAMRQLDFIEDAAEKIKDRIGSGKGFPEWMQNKLSKLHGQMESLYSSLGELEDEDDMEDEMDEAVQSADKKPQKYVRPDGKVGVRMVATDKKVVKND